MKPALLSILVGFAVSFTPVLAQVAQVSPIARSLSDKRPSYSELHEHKGDSYLNLRDWKSAINEYSTCVTEEERKKEKAEKTEIAVPRQQSEHSWTNPPIQVTTLRICLNSPYNRGIVPSALAALPKPVMASLYNHGVKVVVAPTIPDYYLSLNKGTIPDDVSNPSTGKTLDNVEGQYIRSNKIVVIGEQGLDAHDSKRDKVRLVLHELGHAYDNSIGNASDTPTFKLFYDQDMEAIPVSERRKYEFYQQSDRRGCGQVFADTFASLCIDPLCLDPQSKELTLRFPRTYKYMKEILPARQTMK